MLEIEKLDDESEVPGEIVIFPPENSTEDQTDEDSGEEDTVSLSNLPETQLRTVATIPDITKSM